MSKKFLNKGLLAAALFALVLPACSQAFDRGEEGGFTTDDPLSYDSKEDAFVEYEKMEAIQTREATLTDIKKVNLIYINDDGKCNSRRFYTWYDGLSQGVEQPSDTDLTIGDRTYHNDSTTIPLSVNFSNPRYDGYGGKESIWIIIKYAGTWAGQSDDTKILYTDYLDKVDNEGTLNLWIIPAEGSALEICTSYEDTQITKTATAKFESDWKTIRCVSSDPTKLPVWWKLYCFDRVYLSSDSSSQIANKDIYLLKESPATVVGTSEPGVFEIKLNHTAHINIQYMIESVYPGYEDKTPRKIYVSYENLYNTERFNEHYIYNGDDLGVTYTPTQTTFKVWSPISASVDLRLYYDGTPASLGGSDNGRTSQMFYTGNGVWEVTVKGNLLEKENRFYNYIVTNPAGIKVETTDPYAHAVGYNGIRGYVYDPTNSEANPDDWEKVPSVWNGQPGYDIANPNDLSIYEIHIRDLTMDDSWKSNKGNKRGTFNAFVESGTTYTEDFKGTSYTVKTGFDHIKELGVKAVQLLPVFDSENEEDYEKYKFNWGYNPLNYNCVEGAYSSDPTDPMARIKEYKNLIRAFANPDGTDHTRVIMDVVYNHVNSAPNSCFTKLMPKYYFRYTEDWAYTAGSGCANDVRTEAPMMRKYIVDSLKWWATEYKIKGFRFDLMGLIDVETMRQVRNALTEIDPDIYIYGEGWSSGDTRFDEGNWGANSANVYSTLYPGSHSGPEEDKKPVNGYVGGFNDEGRNAIRGNNDSGWAEYGNKYPTWGFANSGKDGAGYFSKVYDMIVGDHTSKGGNPNQMIAYASCHDNYTVWDQLRYTLAGKFSTVDEMGQNGGSSGRSYEKPLRPLKGYEPDICELVAGTIMAHGLVMASNGVAFIQGGEEIYRTKTVSGTAHPEQGIEKTPTEDYEYLTTGGDEAIMRAFPQYMNYDPKNNPDDKDNYDPNAPISILCTGEVRMFNDDEYVSHNSYKMPDSVNSFKWDRKIHVGNTLTYNEFDNWKAMIALRHSSAHYSYDELAGGIRGQFSTWGDYGSNGSIGMYIPNGIHLVMSGSSGGELSIGAGKSFAYSSKGYSEYGSDGVLHMYRQSLFAWK